MSKIAMLKILVETDYDNPDLIDSLEFKLGSRSVIKLEGCFENWQDCTKYLLCECDEW